MRIEAFVSRLQGVRPRGFGRWAAVCPAHEDRSPSLSIKEGERGVLLRCFAGCELSSICHALGIHPRDLFFNAPLPRGFRPTPKAKPLDRVDLAFEFDLRALDLRLRAERIREAGQRLHIATMTDADLDRALNYIACAHDDVQRAELFEHVADGLRERDFNERTNCERQRRSA